MQGVSVDPVQTLAILPLDASVVSLSTADPPIITAVAPRTAFVYVLGMPILVTVYAGTSLPVGTPIWSVPMKSSTNPPIVVPADPSASGADLLMLDDVGLHALAADGSSVWNVPLERSSTTPIIPDFSGGALVITPHPYYDALGNPSTATVLQKANPATGQLTTLHTFSAADGRAVPHPEGVVFV